MKCANPRIISDLPVSGNTRIDNKAMVGYSLSVMIGNEIKQVEVKDYIIDKGRRKFVLGCNGYCDKIIHCFSIFELDHRFKYFNLKEYSSNIFEYSNRYNCWFGWTKKGEKFAFDGEKSDYIKSKSWYLANGYVSCGKTTETLHRVVFGSDYLNYDVIDHINDTLNMGSKKLDNRLCNLRGASFKENANNLTSKMSCKYTGMNRAGDKYITNLKTEYGQIHTKAKEYSEAVIDNLIAQRYLNKFHDSQDFYKLSNLPTDRITSVEEHIDEKIKYLKSKIIKNKTYEYELRISDCCTYYIVEDSKGREFKLSNDEHSLNILKNNCWCVKYDRGKSYVVNTNKKIHRELLGISSIEYNKWVVDHVNGDSLDNRMHNLVITDSKGNAVNRRCKGYSQYGKNSWIVIYMQGYKDDNLFITKAKNPTFKTEIEAVREVERRREYVIKNRVEFKSKNMLDIFISTYKKGA